MCARVCVGIKNTLRKVNVFRLYDQRAEACECACVCVCVGVGVAAPLFVSVFQGLNGV